MDRKLLDQALSISTDWVRQYFDQINSLPVIPTIDTKEMACHLSQRTPEVGMDLEAIFDEFNKRVFPLITHWNHEGFMGYFNSTTSEPSMAAEILIAAINSNGMLWKSCQASSELEKITIDWLSEMLGLNHRGIIFDGGATSNYHAILVIRNHHYGQKLRETGLLGINTPIPRFYISDQTHNSIEKGIYAAGFGKNSIVRVATNDRFEMDISELERLISEDENSGNFDPIAVIATIGSTSCTSIDSLIDISALSKKGKRNLWLHVDAAHGGMAAILPEVREKYIGWETADTITVNPHKWMFVPLDTSVLFFKNGTVMKDSFALEAEYLKTSINNDVDNNMDFGLPLGRRFKSLKLYFTIRFFGKKGIADIIQKHLTWAEYLYKELKTDERFRLMAPLTLSSLCLRVRSSSEKRSCRLSEELIRLINERGDFFLTHTKLKGKFVIRIVLSGYHLNQQKVDALLQELSVCAQLIEQFD